MKKKFLIILLCLIPALVTATEIKNPKLIEKFSLTDTQEHPFTEASLLGQWTLMFFGYTTCFNICPKTLTVVSKTWKLLPAELTEHSLRFVFISLDSETDTPKQLRAFLDGFNPHFIGLTGDSSVIQHLSKSLGVYSYEDPKSSKTGIKMIDHSGALLLINPKGQLQAVFSPPHDEEAIAKELTELSTAH